MAVAVAAEVPASASLPVPSSLPPSLPGCLNAHATPCPCLGLAYSSNHPPACQLTSPGCQCAFTQWWCRKLSHQQRHCALHLAFTDRQQPDKWQQHTNLRQTAAAAGDARLSSCSHTHTLLPQAACGEGSVRHPADSKQDKQEEKMLQQLQAFKDPASVPRALPRQ